MSWFKIDDSFGGHPKVLAIPRKDRAATIGLWTLAGVWCAQHLTNGELGAHMVGELAGTQRQAANLVSTGLWETTENGYLFHDWQDWQPTRESVLARRDAEAKRKQDWRDRKRDKTPRPPDVPPGQARDTPVSPNGVPNMSALPDPTRPDPTRKSSNPSVAETRGSRLPDDFPLTDSMRFWARGNAGNANVDREHEKFCDYWHSKAGAGARKTDWPKTWQNWLRKASDDLERAHAGAQRNPNIPEGWGT